MKKRIYLLSIAITSLLALGSLVSDASASKHVVILAGAGGIERFQKQFQDQANTLKALLISQYGYRERDISLLAEGLPAGQAITAENIRSLFRDLRSRLTGNDALWVFLIGHGSFDGQWAKFNIIGPDLRDVDFANLVDQLPCQRIIFINTTSASGPFLIPMSAKDRVIITATRNGIERNATHFAEYFLQALQNKQHADLNKDGQLSITEAFVYARDQLVRYYEENRQLRPEHPLLDDNGDGEGTETPDLFSGDGSLANRITFEQQLQPATPRLASGGKQSLSSRQKEILKKVQALQAQKNDLPEEVYYQKFEKLMLELAKLNQKTTAAPPAKNRQ